jgi:hypothetical protein
MSPYVKVTFGKETWKSTSSSGMHPKWHEVHSFSFKSSTLEVAVYDKGFLFSDTEIGRCTIHMTDVVQGHSTEWWSLVSPKHEVVGGILLTFEFSEGDSSFAHSSNGSWDLRSHHYAESSPVFTRIKKIHSIQISNFTPEIHKPLHFHTEPDEEVKLEQLKFDLIEEDERLKTQEMKVRMFFEKLKQENDKILLERFEIARETEELRKKEQSLLSDRAGVENEKIAQDQDWEEIERLKESLNFNFNLLKMEKIRIKAQKRVLERTKRKILECFKGIECHRNRIFQVNLDRIHANDRD